MRLTRSLLSVVPLPSLLPPRTLPLPCVGERGKREKVGGGGSNRVHLPPKSDIFECFLPLATTPRPGEEEGGRRKGREGLVVPFGGSGRWESLREG